MARVPKKSSTQTAPPMDKLLKPAVGVAIAMLGYYVMKGSEWMVVFFLWVGGWLIMPCFLPPLFCRRRRRHRRRRSPPRLISIIARRIIDPIHPSKPPSVTNEIPRIDVTDQLALREVIFGEGSAGKDYAVLCHPDAKAGSVGLPVSSVFQDSRDDGSAPVEYVLVDCDHVLPESGKSIYEKFNLNKKKRPVVFVSGKVGPPKQVPEKHLKTGGMLTKLLKQMLEPHAAKIERTKELKEKCLNKDVCGLLLKGGKPEPYVKHAVANLLGKYPSVQFASIDSTALFLTNLEEYLPEYVAGEQ